MNQLLKNKAGVTLLELMIVMAIMGILSIVLFRTFVAVSEISFRIQQQKNVGTEIITLSQIIQNYADRNSVDYDRYRVTSNEGGVPNDLSNTRDSSLVTANGLTSILYLSGQDGQLALYASGDCIDLGTPPLTGLQDQSCVFYVQNNENIFPITNPAKLYLSKVMFKIIPFASEEGYLSNPQLCAQDNLITCINAPGFWMLAEAYNAKYTPGQWGNTIKIPIQEFFNLK